MKAGIRQVIFQPYLSSLLRQRGPCLALMIFTLILLASQFLGLELWPCPFHRLTRLDCPGCGLTRAVAALLEGDWQQSLRSHPLAGLFLAGWILLPLSLALPARLREKMLAHLEKLERRTGAVLILLLLFLLFGIVRLIFEVYFVLIKV